MLSKISSRAITKGFMVILGLLRNREDALEVRPGNFFSRLSKDQQFSRRLVFLHLDLSNRRQHVD
jgi:hypothetical protein